MRELTHLSLFSGIGGLDIAAEWAGFITVGQCEWSEYPVRVLEKHWPDVPRWKDIRTLTGESFYERTGRRTVDVISGGFPCQPFSVAGKQRGREDDRYLWPEMVRVIKELRPAWVVGENVAGIVRMALPDILSELEACGYRTRAFLIPACAVGARHRRYRVAIVGYSEHDGLSSREVQGGILKGTGGSGYGKNVADTKGPHKGRLSVRKEKEESRLTFGGEDAQHTDSPGRKEQHIPGESDKQGFPGRGCDEGNVCDPAGEGFSDRTGEQMGGQGTQKPESERPDSHVSDSDNGSRDVRRNGELSAVEETGRERSDYRDGEEEYEPGERRPAESGLGGVADGIPGWVDGDLDFILNHYWDEEPDIPRIADGVANRVNRLKALGNAVVPQQFYPVFKAIVEVEGIWKD